MRWCIDLVLMILWHVFLSMVCSGTSSRRVWRALTPTGITASPSWITTICSWPVFWWWFCPSSFTCSVWDAYTAAPHSTSSGWKRAWGHLTSLCPYRARSLSVKPLANHWRRRRSKTSPSPTIIMLPSHWPVLHFPKMILHDIFNRDQWTFTVMWRLQDRVWSAVMFSCLFIVRGTLRLPFWIFIVTINVKEVMHVEYVVYILNWVPSLDLHRQGSAGRCLNSRRIIEHLSNDLVVPKRNGSRFRHWSWTALISW